MDDGMKVARLRGLLKYLHSIREDQFEAVTHRPAPKPGQSILPGHRRGSLAHHVIMLFPNEAKAEDQRKNCSRAITQVAQRVLGLNTEQAGDLFLGVNAGYPMTSVTLSEVMSAVSVLINEGKVRWPPRG